ncbi:MAG: sigma-70 family RNA polymerase sigma factor [Deltaproteobacteria bacterium]|nr:sigma-70 family RNA polymerase sigma factor [Deltaproteobacteria bacterium]
MSRRAGKALPIEDILARARKQGQLTIDELAELLPCEATVEQTAELIDSLDKHQIPVLDSDARRAPGSARRWRSKMLTREEEIELAGRIRKGRSRSIQAALRAPGSVKEIVKAARRVASSKCSIWDVLADFEGAHPDEDERQARLQLREVARDLEGRLDDLKKMERAARRSADAAPLHRRLSTLRRAMAARLMRLDFRDSFIERILKPIAVEASRVKTALAELAALESELGLPAGSLGGSAQQRDADLRGVLKIAKLTRARMDKATAQVKNLKRVFRSVHRRTGMVPDDLLAAAAEIRAGARDATRARQALVEANQRLVIGIARRYPHPTLDFLDLVQEGNLGLMRAAERFDPSRGFRFGTYATWWVRQSIGRLLAEQGSAVRIPPHVQESLQKLNRLSRRIVLRTGKEPTVDQLASCLGKSPERIKEILSAGHRPVSTETKVGDGDSGATLLDFIPDPRAGPDEQADRRVQHSSLHDAMSALSEREREIICMRFQDGLTLQEVGKHFGITRERTRQLQQQALLKLRKRLKADLLRRIIQDQNCPQEGEPADRRPTGQKKRGPGKKGP